MFLEILQNLQENTSARVYFSKVALRPATLLKMTIWHRGFPVTPLVAASDVFKRTIWDTSNETTEWSQISWGLQILFKDNIKMLSWTDFLQRLDPQVLLNTGTVLLR